MSNLHRRLKKVEEKLNLNQEHVTFNIIHWRRGELPPDRTDGNITIHYVAYEDVLREKANQ